MRCESCGKTVFEKIFAKIDGVRMLLCPECAGAFGSDVEEEHLRDSQTLRPRQSFQPRQKPELSEGLDLKQDFGSLIRKKRQALNLTVEELAKKIFEKESTLHKIENQKIVPSDALLAKIEKALQVNLREKIVE